jgi:hypothetical protein
MTWARGARRWPRLLFAGAAAGFYVGAVSEAIGGLLFGDAWSWAEMAVHVVGWAVLAPPIWTVMTRAVVRGSLPLNPSGRVRVRQRVLIAPAMASGCLPADADPAVWRRALDGEARELSSTWWLTVVFAVVACASIGAAAVVANGNDWRVWAVALVVAGEAWSVLRFTARRLSTARSLLARASTP